MKHSILPEDSQQYQPEMWTIRKDHNWKNYVDSKRQIKDNDKS